LQCASENRAKKDPALWQALFFTVLYPSSQTILQKLKSIHHPKEFAVKANI